MGQKAKSVSLVLDNVVINIDWNYDGSASSSNSLLLPKQFKLLTGAGIHRMAAVAADSGRNVHVVWSRGTQHLWYSMISPRGETLIDATQVTTTDFHKIYHP